MVKMPKLALPKGKKGKRIVLVSSISVVAVIAAVVILYFTNKKFKRMIDNLLKRGDEGPLVEVADNVVFEMPDDRVPPDAEFTIIGKFTDRDGKPVRVKQGLYYVIKNASGESGPRELLTQGTLGTNIHSFSKVVSTSGFPRGNDYDVVVTDTPLSVADIQGTGQQEGPGLGEGGGFPLGIGKGDREGAQVRQSQKLGISGLT